MKMIKRGSVTYLLSLIVSMLLLYMATGNIMMLFSTRGVSMFLGASLVFAIISVIMYFSSMALLDKSKRLIPILWILLPLIFLSIYMQVAFQAIYGHMHGFGYIHGLGPARPIWILLCTISVVFSVITYWFFVRKR